MNVTNHCLKRYAERFKDVLKSDLDRDILANKDLYIEIRLGNCQALACAEE